MDPGFPIRSWFGKTFMATFLSLWLVGCAAQHGPVPYPNGHLQRVGEVQTRQDIADCNRLAEEHVKFEPGAEVAKSAAGGAGAGAIIGGAMGAPLPGI
jgi:outer membrane lipoprotein SlyB